MQTTNWDYEGMWVLKVKVISLPYIFQVLYVLCFTRPSYQVSVYRTIEYYQIILSNSKQSFNIVYFLHKIILNVSSNSRIVQMSMGLSKKIIFFQLVLILFTFLSTPQLSCFKLAFHTRRKKIRKTHAYSTQNPRYFLAKSTQKSHVTCEIPR